MSTRYRPLGRAPAALLSLALCVASACIEQPAPTQPDAGPGGIEIPRGVSLPPLAYTLTLTYASEPWLVPRPESISGHLYLDVDADGLVSGTISTRDSDTVGLAAISGHAERTEIVIVDGSVGIGPQGSLGLDELRIVLLDGDRDGTADGAAGEASGSWSGSIGDIVDASTHTSVLAASLDTTATTASLSVPRGHPAFLPYDAVRVAFQEPLREADVRDNLRILASGTAVTGELTLAATGGLVIGATFQPDAFLAFDAEVTIDLGKLQDPSGNALTASDDRVPVVADPGTLTGNTGFESDLDGWIVLGGASTESEFQGFAPAEGAAQAVVREESMLVTYLDVPAGATEIDLSVTVLTYVQEIYDDHTTVIGLRRPGGELIEIFDAGDVADQYQLCAACPEFRGAVGPLRRTLDLTPYRGQRVFLTVDVRSFFFIGPEPVAALVDDIQIR